MFFRLAGQFLEPSIYLCSNIQPSNIQPNNYYVVIYYKGIHLREELRTARYRLFGVSLAGGVSRA